MRTPAENVSLWDQLPDAAVGMVPGPLKPGQVVDLGDGEPWCVVKLELRGGLGGAPWEHWALLTRGEHGRRWVQVEPKASQGNEADVVALVAQRLELGRAQYGPLQVDTDHRSFEHEALEELLDATVYLASRLLQVRRETWLNENPEALASVKRGLAQAKGQLKSLDLAAAQAVAKQCEDD